MKITKYSWSICAGLLLASSMSVANIVTSLTDFNTQTVSATAIQIDTFDNDIVGGVSITHDSGVVSTLSGGNLNFAGGSIDNAVNSGRFNGVVDRDGGFGALTLTFDFGADIVAFGFDADSFNSTYVNVDSSATFFGIDAELGNDSGFFGIVDLKTPFQTLQFRGNSINIDIFGIDNLRFVFASDIEVDAMPVPVPASLGLLLVGLIGLSAQRRIKR